MQNSFKPRGPGSTVCVELLTKPGRGSVGCTVGGTALENSEQQNLKKVVLTLKEKAHF